MSEGFASRRQFLQRAGAAAFTTSLFTGKIRGANDRVNVGFLGVGRRGLENIGYAAQVAGLQVVSVCDVDGPARQKAAVEARKMGFGEVREAEGLPRGVG